MHMEKLATDSNPPEEEGWQIKIANLISGGAVDEARAILEIDKMYAPGSIEKIGAMMSISLRNATNETFGARGISGWRNYRGTLSKNNTSFFKGTKYSNKVLSQMSNKKDIVHSFPRSVDGYVNKFGKQTIRTGGNGKSYIWLEMRGSYRGKMGIFEYIKDKNGLINHRYFNTSK